LVVSMDLLDQATSQCCPDEGYVYVWILCVDPSALEGCTHRA